MMAPWSVPIGLVCASPGVNARVALPASAGGLERFSNAPGVGRGTVPLAMARTPPMQLGGASWRSTGTGSSRATVRERGVGRLTANLTPDCGGHSATSPREERSRQPCFGSAPGVGPPTLAASRGPRSTISSW